MAKESHLQQWRRVIMDDSTPEPSAAEAPAGYEKMRGGKPVTFWRDDALEAAAGIVEAYGADPQIAVDIRAMKSKPKADSAEPRPLTTEEHQVLRASVRDSAEVVAPGRLADTAAAAEGVTDAEIAHLWDTRVGYPSAKYPLGQAEIISFARAVLALRPASGDALQEDIEPINAGAKRPATVRKAFNDPTNGDTFKQNAKVLRVAAREQALEEAAKLVQGYCTHGDQTQGWQDTFASAIRKLKERSNA